MQLWRLVLEEERHPVVHLGRLDEVVVVQDQHQVGRQPVEVVEQRSERRIDRRRGRRQQLERSVAESRHGGLHGGHHVGPEQRGVVVAPVQRQPGDRGSVRGSPGKPFGEQGRLAEPSRRGQDRERRPGRGSEAFSQPPARDCTRPLKRQAVLAVQEGTHHSPILPPDEAVLACVSCVPWCRKDSPHTDERGLHVVRRGPAQAEARLSAGLAV